MAACNRKNLKVVYFTGEMFHTVDLVVPSAEDDDAIERFRTALYNIASQAIIDFEFEGGTYVKKTQAQRFRR